MNHEKKSEIFSVSKKSQSDFLGYKQTFLLVILVLSVLSLSRIRFLEESIVPGNELELHTSIVNHGSKDVEDVRVIALFPEIGETMRANNFDIDDNYGKLMWWDIPSSIPKGEYLVRITASSDKHRSRKFRYITIE